jgi:hypothetical protein
MRWPTRRELWFAGVVLAIVLVWASRFFVNPDGVSFLDLSDDIAAGQWGSAVNAHWGPLYPAILSVWLRPLSPGSPFESTAVHALNGVLFLVSIGTFDFFLRELGASQRKISGDKPAWAMAIDSPAGLNAAYAIFFFCCLVLVGVRVVTPDMLLVALLFAAAALIVRIERGEAGVTAFIFLGALLGLGFLAKAVMLPVSLFLMAASFFATRKIPEYAAKHSIAVAMFAVFVAPQIVSLSIKAGRPTFSNSAEIVYGLKVNRYPKLWNGKPEGSGTPLNPIVAINENPNAFAFPVNLPHRTYPLWDDPAVWYEGMTPHFNVSDQRAALSRNLKSDLGFSLKILLPLLVVLLFRDRRIRPRHLLFVGTAMLVTVAYLFLHIESRLAGPWLAIIVTSLLAGVAIDPRGIRRTAGVYAVHLVTAICLISIVTYVIDQSFSSKADRGLVSQNLPYEVAQRVHALAIPRGARVALVGDESDIYWARLSGVQVAFQIPLPEADSYWAMSAAARDSLHRMLAARGASAVIASWTAPPDSLGEWHRVAGTRFSILPLTEMQ